jgi:hypothetical protein
MLKWWRSGVIRFLVLTPLLGEAQTSPRIPPGSQLQLQVAQPMVDVSTPVTATSSFDPPAVPVGGKAFYRVNVDATESSIDWPDQLPVPAELKFSAKKSGQITLMQANQYRPLASFVYEVAAPVAGHYTITNFSINVSGVVVEVPAASLEVGAPSPGWPLPRRLELEVSATNVFLGQPFHARVILPVGPGNEIEALREIELRGEGLMLDKTAMRQSVETINQQGELKPALICEMTVTPIAVGRLEFTAQGFTAGREFAAPISIRGQVNFQGGPPKYVLLVSDPVELNVRPLPAEGELPGFTGSIGKFFADPPRLATNRLNLGEPVQLSLSFHGEGELTRLVPPTAPTSRDWQIIADPPPATSFTLIPLTDEVRLTPAIPFCYFDPAMEKYMDLTIPPQPITVVGQSLPVEQPVVDEAGKADARLKLSSVAPTPGKEVRSLKPLQLKTWFVGMQLAPVAGFLALWQWDRRRRYLAAHPEIVRRAQARRALRREKQRMLKALTVGDASAFARHAARAMGIAAAPHFPADARAMVCADVLSQLDMSGQNKLAAETVRQVFAAADAQFALHHRPLPDLLALGPGVKSVLQKLEEKL